MGRLMIFLGAALFFAAAGGAQTEKRAPQTAPAVPANAWMKTPYDISSHDDLAPDLRRARDKYWDGLLGFFGVLTPQTAVHSSEDGGLRPRDMPEIPDLRSNQAAFIGTFKSYRSVLTASGRAIYTDVAFMVDHVFQDAIGGRAVAGAEVTVGLRGGTVRTGPGQVISHLTEPRVYFVQPGRTYLLIESYKADGEFYVGGIPAWDLSDGVVRANYDAEREKAQGRQVTLVGLTKEDLTRALDERFSGKR